jgi:hypothetical protein
MDVAENTKRHYEIYCLYLLACTIAMAVVAMYKHCGRVLESESLICNLTTVYCNIRAMVAHSV